MNIIEPRKQIKRIKNIIFNDMIMSGLPSNEKIDIYYLSEKYGIVYIMDDKEDFIENKDKYNPVGIIDFNEIKFSHLDEYLKELFDIYNLTFN